MSLDVTLTATRPTEVYSANITHNLNGMALEAGIYYQLWRPEDVGIKIAGDLIEPLRAGLAELESNPDKYKVLNPKNRWGSYDGLVIFVRDYLKACETYPDAIIDVSR